MLAILRESYEMLTGNVRKQLFMGGGAHIAQFSLTTLRGCALHLCPENPSVERAV